MRRPEPELTDEDLERLARLGGGVDQIAEAAGIDVDQVGRRLVRSTRPARSDDPGRARAGGARIC